MQWWSPRCSSSLRVRVGGGSSEQSWNRCAETHASRPPRTHPRRRSHCTPPTSAAWRCCRPTRPQGRPHGCCRLRAHSQGRMGVAERASTPAPLPPPFPLTCAVVAGTAVRAGRGRAAEGAPRGVADAGGGDAVRARVARVRPRVGRRLRASHVRRGCRRRAGVARDGAAAPRAVCARVQSHHRLAHNHISPPPAFPRATAGIAHSLVLLQVRDTDWAQNPALACARPHR
jgi:hypothetical protein